MHSTPRFGNFLSVQIAAIMVAGALAAQTSLQATPESAAPDQFEGLPAFLLPVPGGKVEIGLTAEDLINAACQASMPSRPEMAVRSSAKAVENAMKRSASTLGRRD